MYRSVVWTLSWPRRYWICSISPPASWHKRAQVRRKSCGATPGNPHWLQALVHNRPDHFWTEPVWRNSPRLVDRAEHGSGSHGRSGHPRLNGGTDPVWNWNGSDVAALPDQISKDPMVFAPLEVGDRYSSKLRPGEAHSLAAPRPSRNLVCRGVCAGCRHAVGSDPARW